MPTETFTDVHGVSVLSRWWPIESPRAVVLLSHGASEHSGRYDDFARSLNASQFYVAALDHRGHGGTADGPTAVVGAGGGQALIDDLDELHHRVRRVVGEDVPVFLFGHSLGAIIALVYLVQHSSALAGAVLMGVPAAVNEASDTAALLAGFDTPDGRALPAGELLRSFNDPFEPARTPFDWLTRDEAAVDAYLADPQCGDNHPLTYGFLLDLFLIAAPANDALAKVSCPLLLLSGDRDSSSAMGASLGLLRNRLNEAGVADVDEKLYPGARHELLNELNRDDVVADVTNWILRHVTP